MNSLENLCDEEKQAIVETTEGKKYMRLFRGGCLMQIKDHGHMDNVQVMSFTTDYNVAKKFAFNPKRPEWHPGVTDPKNRVIYEIYVPIVEISFDENENWFSKTLSREWGNEEKEYTAFYQIPVEWIKRWETAEGLIVTNIKFNPNFIPSERKKLTIDSRLGGKNYYNCDN